MYVPGISDFPIFRYLCKSFYFELKNSWKIIIFTTYIYLYYITSFQCLLTSIVLPIIEVYRPQDVNPPLTGATNGFDFFDAAFCNSSSIYISIQRLYRPFFSFFFAIIVHRRYSPLEIAIVIESSTVCANIAANGQQSGTRSNCLSSVHRTSLLGRRPIRRSSPVFLHDKTLAG